MADSVWERAVREAEEQLGRVLPGIARTVGAVNNALGAERRAAFQRELSGLGDGGTFEVLLDAWWTQAVVDSVSDAESREALLEVADLAVSLRIASRHDPVAQAEIDVLMNAWGVDR
ncbi:hypothetical protein ACL02R_10250 [Streptomyces sp. MS19]|uniref:hypothetical protein n=1 Tax=Streptomyces sp. MS19 TaxID=3385972 RepID=UPI00399F9D31